MKLKRVQWVQADLVQTEYQTLVWLHVHIPLKTLLTSRTAIHILSQKSYMCAVPSKIAGEEAGVQE